MAKDIDVLQGVNFFNYLYARMDECSGGFLDIFGRASSLYNTRALRMFSKNSHKGDFFCEK